MAVYSWGFGKYGQLGNGSTTSAEVPQLVKLPSGVHPKKVSCGAHFTAVLCSSAKKGGAGGGGASSGTCKRVFACGWGKYGRLGTGSEEDKVFLTEVSWHYGLASYPRLLPSTDHLQYSTAGWWILQVIHAG